MKIHCCVHDVGSANPRMRVWSDEKYRGVAAAVLVSYQDLESIHGAVAVLRAKLGIGDIILHRCGVGDGPYYCKCKPVPLSIPIAIN